MCLATRRFTLPKRNLAVYWLIIMSNHCPNLVAIERRKRLLRLIRFRYPGEYRFERPDRNSFSYPELRSSWPAPRIESSGTQRSNECACPWLSTSGLFPDPRCSARPINMPRNFWNEILLGIFFLSDESLPKWFRSYYTFNVALASSLLHVHPLLTSHSAWINVGVSYMDT